ncbi:basic membrane protein A and related proteins [Janthinobacterium sp. CG_23.3]|uniref:BMP family ABC transporter substrate-binding protein n=1 Tax=unclassified Janthinobacterium TaxID=2610881 RepID=UPI000347A39A|nr:MULTISPECIES: BMP family ABC transporter substrate-binding protein [unclassified Janthinobacterium]MEC5160704.1 basic membrane protein A [Janthinobacterium sp. CG_S6]
MSHDFRRTHLNKTARLLAGLAALLGFAMAGKGQAAEPLKTCFLYSNPIGESGWTYQHELARRELAAAYGDKISTKYVENVAEGPDAERVIRNFVQEGCKLIFTPSFGFMEPTLKVARQAPRVIFMNASGYKTAPNVGAYNGRYYEGRYLEGVLAGHVSKKGVVGYVGAFPIPEVLQGLNAFTLGLRSVNPNAQVKLIWVNAWYDPGKERDAANTLATLGVDVLAYATSGVAVVTAAEEKGIPTLGYYSDMSKFGPKTSQTSVLQTWGGYYIKVVDDVLAGRWKSASVVGGLREGMIKMAPLNGALAPELREKFAAVERDIVEGRLFPFAGPIYDQSGKQRVAAGKVMGNADLDNMNYLVTGIDGSVPKR